MSDNRYKEPSQPVDRNGNGGLVVAAIFAVAAIIGIAAYVVMSNDTRKADAVETAAERVGDAAQNVGNTVPAPPPANGPPIQINVPAPAAPAQAAPVAVPAAPAPAAPVRAPQETPPTEGATAPSDSDDIPPPK